MLARIVLLTVGFLALLASVLLSVAWFQQGNVAGPPAVAKPPVMVSVLAAARPVAAGTLLRPQDMTWKDVTEAEVLDPAMVRGKANEADYAGAVTRIAYDTAQPLLSSGLARPGDREFLTAALAAGTRAVSVSVDAAQSTSGLVLPGDRVDVILTQAFNVQGGDIRRKTVGETVLRDLRVIAVDQISNPTLRPNESKPGSGEFRTPRTVTLEVTERQGEILLVADQLGKIQLALRGRDPGVASAPSEPIWASEVSPALDGLGNAPAPAPAAAAPERAQKSVDVIRGSKVERRCLTAGGYVPCS